MYYQPTKFNLNTLYTQLIALCGDLSTTRIVSNKTHMNGDVVRLLEVDRKTSLIRFNLEVTRNDKPLFSALVRVYPGQKVAYGVRLTRNYAGADSTLKRNPDFNVGAYMEINDFLYAWIVQGQYVEPPHMLDVEAVA